MEEKNKATWEISVGLYPGIMIGARTYDWSNARQFVLYLPFIDVSFMLFDGE